MSVERLYSTLSLRILTHSHRGCAPAQPQDKAQVEYLPYITYIAQYWMLKDYEFEVSADLFRTPSGGFPEYLPQETSLDTE